MRENVTAIDGRLMQIRICVKVKSRYFEHKL